MLNIDDQRWEKLLGGYRRPYDPRSALAKLRSGTNDAMVWEELWNELHHQGDVGEASYAAVPHLVSIYGKRPSADWNVYAIVAIIELARKHGSNPDVPTWLDSSYFSGDSGTGESRTPGTAARTRYRRDQSYYKCRRHRKRASHPRKISFGIL
jgi:hypothetical protein